MKDIEVQNTFRIEEEETLQSKRARKEISYGPHFLMYLLEKEPQSYIEAMSTPEAPFWKNAVESEINSVI